MTNTNDKFNAKRKEETRAKYAAAIYECDRAGTRDEKSVCAAVGVTPASLRRYLRENRSTLPQDIYALAWVEDMIRVVPFAEAGARAKGNGIPKKRKFKFPAASAKAKVKRGWEVSATRLNAAPPRVDISLKPLPAGLMIEGADKWGKASHERAQN